MSLFSKPIETKNTDAFEYLSVIQDLIQHEKVLSMKGFIHHNNISCFEHSLHVSYYSYKLSKFLGFDCRSSARGGLLHDLFLYDWHTTKLEKGMHGFQHPYTALQNAKGIFDLSLREEDIIVKHMWPLTLKRPRYMESLVVCFVDKYCAMMEVITAWRPIELHFLREIP